MPAADFTLPNNSVPQWLDHDTPEKELKAMLRPFPAEVMTARMADPIMNKATVDGPECLAVTVG